MSPHKKEPYFRRKKNLKRNYANETCILFIIIAFIWSVHIEIINTLNLKIYIQINTKNDVIPIFV